MKPDINNLLFSSPLFERPMSLSNLFHLSNFDLLIIRQLIKERSSKRGSNYLHLG